MGGSEQEVKSLEVIPKTALMPKMSYFGDWQGGRPVRRSFSEDGSRHSCNYSDAGQRRPGSKITICRPNEVLGWLLIFEQVRAVFFGAFESLCPPPFLDFAVISTEQNVWYLHASKILRAGILGVFESRRAGTTERIVLG